MTFRTAIAAALLLGAGRLSAQDVLLQGPWLIPDPDSPMDQGPAIVAAKLPDYPKAWLRDGKPHWASLGFIVDKKGRPDQNVDVDGENPASEQLHKVAQDWKFKPATYRGRPAASRCRVVLIFNPSPAAPTDADAPPRLLEVALAPQLAVMRDSPYAPYFGVKVRVEADGASKVLFLEPHERSASDDPERQALYRTPEAADAVRAMVAGWKFSPARQGGRPAAAEFKIVAWIPNDNCLFLVPPEPRHREIPVYPLSLRRTGNRGEVVMNMFIGKDGKVHDARVISSTHPAFEPPAIAAAMKWTFEPAKMRGVPIDLFVQQPIDFRLEGTGDFGFPTDDSGVEAFDVRGADLSKMPARYRYDVPPKPKLTVAPVFPWALARTGREGSAAVVLLLSEKGEVEDVQVQQASEPEFGRSLEAAARCWTFEPASREGQPTATLLRYEYKFGREGRDSVLDDEAVDFLRLIERHPERIATLRDLDAVPKPLYRVPPVFPDGAPAGKVIVEFYIDEGGKVRFPHVVSGGDDALAYPALTAVSRWQFEPPRKGGRKVSAVAQIPIGYGLKKPAASTARPQ